MAPIHLADTAPSATLLKGHMDAMFEDKLGFVTRSAREHGDVVRLRFGPVHAFLLSHPTHVGEVLTTKADAFVKSHGLRRAKVLLGEGLLTSEGEVHARRSRIAQPAFQKAAVAGYADAMVDLTRTVIESWKPGARIDLAAELSRLTLAIAARTLFGANLLTEATGLGDALTEALELLDHRLQRIIPFPMAIPTAENRRLRAARQVLDDAVYGMIRARREGRHAEPDLLSRLLAKPEGDDAALTDEELRDEVMTIFLAGHETTANALGFAFWLLARHPEARERVAREARELLDGGARLPGADDLARLPYTQQVFSEAMRLYPPAWMIARRAVRSVELADGVRIPRESVVMLSAYVVHRDARWHPEPLAFRPERFAPDAPRMVPFSYFPFGGGKRACIGRSFAMLEGPLVLATIASRVDLEIDAREELALSTHMTLRPERGLAAVVSFASAQRL